MERYFPILVTGLSIFKADPQRMLPELTSLLHLSMRHGSRAAEACKRCRTHQELVPWPPRKISC